jgi:hypothetical protein
MSWDMRQAAFIFLALLMCSCGWKTPSDKINGVSFVGSRDAASQAHVDALVGLNADYAAVMPFGFIRELGSPEIIYDTDRQWFGETRAGARQYIELLHKNGIRVMLKPQIWIWRGVFTGDLKMESEEDWRRLEKSYSEFVLSFAQLAEETGAEMFCIGTELEEFVKARPEYWTRLIGQIRTVYTGKLTYAANWDEYKSTPFWGALDYVGVDAYFPLSEARDPSVVELRENWKRWKNEIREVSEKADRPVLFTEYGYRSMDYTAKKPWLVDRSDQRVNLEAQANAKIALFEEFWDEAWFAGGFVWKWFIHHPVSGGPSDNRFTPQNKPAENVIREYYQRHR